MGEIMEIMVTPEILKQSEQTMKGLLNNALSGYCEMEEAVRETEGCFKGKSADRIRKRIEKKVEKGTGLIEELRTFPVLLSQISEEYADAERTNENVANRN